MASENIVNGGGNIGKVSDSGIKNPCREINDLSNPTLIIATVGLPRSGKTTWCARYINDGPVIINPDSFRLAIHGQAFNRRCERHVWASVYDAINALAIANHRVILFDATNIDENRRKELFYATKDYCGVKYIIFDIPAEECIARCRHDSRFDLIPIIESMEKKKNLAIPPEFLITFKEVDFVIEQRLK